MSKNANTEDTDIPEDANTEDTDIPEDANTSEETAPTKYDKKIGFYPIETAGLMKSLKEGKHIPEGAIITEKNKGAFLRIGILNSFGITPVAKKGKSDSEKADKSTDDLIEVMGALPQEMQDRILLRIKASQKND